MITEYDSAMTNCIGAESENRTEQTLEGQVSVRQMKAGRFGKWGWRVE